VTRPAAAGSAAVESVEGRGAGAASPTPPAERPTLPPETLEWIRRTRRHPRLTQPDFLILRRLVQHLAAALRRFTEPVAVLDVYCGTRPYEDLLPAGSSVTGFDIDNHYGAADVTSDEFLPFGDGSFDLVLFTEGFFYLGDPDGAQAELRRVLRPGGSLVLTIPLVWEYHRERLEHRFSGPELAALFARDWQGVEVEEVGGYAVAWATQSGRIVRGIEESFTHRGGLWRALQPLFVPAYLGINAVALALDRFERRLWRPWPYVLADHLLLLARRPDG
jgi:SAM-dependent methyltransferase